jgi:hypothetical protein
MHIRNTVCRNAGPCKYCNELSGYVNERKFLTERILVSQGFSCIEFVTIMQFVSGFIFLVHLRC